jgi:predicted transcriptional regulator
MQTTLFTLNAGASVKQVAYLLGRVGAPMVMVLSEQNTLVGLITPSELLWHLSPAQVSDTQG